MAEEWVKEAQNDVKNEAYLHFEAEKALRARKKENTELLSKLATEERERERKSAQAGQRNAETQAEDQHKLLYQTELELATSSQLTLDLKAKLQKTKEAV